jgi:hypothetical protein
MKKEATALPPFPSALDPIPKYLTHYFERSAGPFLNICDLGDDEVQRIRKFELSNNIEFSRFRAWPEFIKSRRAADDLLIQLYEEKFQKTPSHRPVFAVLGDCPKIPSMYVNPQSLRIAISDLRADEVTFMYPDHAHLIQFFNHEAPAFGVTLPKNYSEESMPYYGKLFTYDDLRKLHIEYGIKERIDRCLDGPNPFVFSYVEAHIWTRDVKSTPIDLRNIEESNQSELSTPFARPSLTTS